MRDSVKQILVLAVTLVVGVVLGVFGAKMTPEQKEIVEKSGELVKEAIEAVPEKPVQEDAPSADEAEAE